VTGWLFRSTLWCAAGVLSLVGVNDAKFELDRPLVMQPLVNLMQQHGLPERLQALFEEGGNRMIKNLLHFTQYRVSWNWPAITTGIVDLDTITRTPMKRPPRKRKAPAAGAPVDGPAPLLDVPRAGDAPSDSDDDGGPEAGRAPELEKWLEEMMDLGVASDSDDDIDIDVPVDAGPGDTGVRADDDGGVGAPDGDPDDSHGVAATDVPGDIEDAPIDVPLPAFAAAVPYRAVDAATRERVLEFVAVMCLELARTL
jgi:hypothetical protein